MKLLIITQKVDMNDDLLGIYHEWIKRIAARCESVFVICLCKGEHDLPENVKIFSLGKEKMESNFRYLFNFYKHIWRLRKQYDTVFVHMNPEYIILGGLFWKICGKKTVLWYAHYLSNLKLKVAIILADKIVTSIKQAFPLKSRKLEVLQQGIDTDKFSPKTDVRESAGVLRILSLGRISPIKKHEILIDSAVILKEGGVSFFLTIAGEPAGAAKDLRFYDNLVQKVKKTDMEDVVKFIGKVPNIETPSVYNNNDIFVNLTPTGSFDKTILEAMACGLAVFVSNRAYRDIFDKDLENVLMFKEGDAKELAEKIANFVKLPEDRKSEMKIRLRNLVVKNHNLDGLINKLIYVLEA